MSKLSALARADAYARSVPSGDSVGSMFRPDVEVNLTRRPFEAASEVEGRSGDPWKANRIVITAMSSVAETSCQLYRRPGFGVAGLSSTAAMELYARWGIDAINRGADDEPPIAARSRTTP